jgi:predicted Zn-dependent protease
MKLLYLSILAISITSVAQQAPLPAGSHDPDGPATSSSTLASTKPAGIAPALAAAEDKIESHDFDGARPSLLGYLQQHPADARALFDLGFVEDSTGQQDAAERDYGKAIAADPKQFESHAALGLLYAQTSRADKAVPELQTATQLEPANHDEAAKAQVWRSLAQLQLAGDPVGAKNSLVKALELAPGTETPADLVLTGQIAEANDDPQDAGVAYRRALAQEPASAGATSGLAHLLLKENKPQEAEPLLRAALAKHPEDAGLTAQLATALSAEGNQAEATAALEKLHQLQPANVEVTGMLADAYLRNGAPDKAAPLLADAVQTAPNNPGLLASYGQSLIYTRQFASAIPILERAAAADPHNEDAWAGLAFAHSQLHQDAEVVKDLSARQKIAADTPETLFLWATSYDNLHQMKQAAEYYERFLAVAQGKYPNEEWQAKHRLVALGHSH